MVGRIKRMFEKTRLYTPEGGFVTEVELPPFLTKPEVLIWGARVFIHVDTFIETFIESRPLREEEDGCYVEAFAYYVPPRAEELPVIDLLESTNMDEPIVIPDPNLCWEGMPAPDHYVNRRFQDEPPTEEQLKKLRAVAYEADSERRAALAEEAEEAIRKVSPNAWQMFIDNSPPPGEGERPLYDRIYVLPESVMPENVPEGCSCEMPPGYHWTRCPVTLWGLRNGKARQLYEKQEELSKPASPPRRVRMIGEAFNCGYCHNRFSFMGLDRNPQDESGATYCTAGHLRLAGENLDGWAFCPRCGLTSPFPCPIHT